MLPSHSRVKPEHSKRGKIFGFSEISNQDFRGGSSSPQPPCYQLLLCPKFDSLLNPTTTVQDQLWTHSPSQLLQKTFFSAPPCPGIQSNQCTWYQPWEAAHLSFFAPCLSNVHPGPRLISLAYGLTRRLFSDSVTITQSSIHLWL